ncbi:acyl-CoA dehydrogenase [Nocardia panacis]|uniref:Acyl-CoA dehydrogenase n=1 Tax=Nocardia panacis TaxID=2340916 RepID=A0A3A4KKA7_9NOCA|nr:acyl-CoA dehydrogenase family protein [Nocardia panacis]RJO75121.1 acyl-CoA dehydrogenase [Nocardia panacis]
MNDIVAELVSAVADACAKHGDPEADGWDERLWATLARIGVTTIGVADEYGGAGGDLGTAVAVLRALGRHSAKVPLAETALLAGWLLAECGVALPPGSMTACLAGPELRCRPGADGLSVSGTMTRVPWARYVDHLVVLTQERVIVLRRTDFSTHPGANVAGEPRDTVTVGTIIPADRVHFAGSRLSASALRQRAALARAALISGAGRRALDLSIGYAGEREQFGRPIAKFQAVQQYLATMAGEVLLCEVAVDAAAQALDSGADAAVAVAGAKTVAGQMAGVVSALAHQIHGAIGYTEEHSLRHSTTRLWAWRDEAGNEDLWSADLGRRALAAGSAGLWPLITGNR